MWGWANPPVGPIATDAAMPKALIAASGPSGLRSLSLQTATRRVPQPQEPRYGPVRFGLPTTARLRC